MQNIVFAQTADANHIEKQPKLSRTEQLKKYLQESAEAREKLNKIANNKVTQVSAKVEKLVDNTGLVYIGATISSYDLEPYLRQMIAALGTEKFVKYRANQAARDNHSFHVTLINPFELKQLTKPVTLGKTISFTLLGLGKAEGKPIEQMGRNAQISEKIPHNSYFVVVKSNEGQFFRSQFGLSAKDFHITLGFNPSDVFGVDKSEKALIYNNQ
jgi:hypothetical protein